MTWPSSTPLQWPGAASTTAPLGGMPEKVHPETVPDGGGGGAGLWLLLALAVGLAVWLWKRAQLQKADEVAKTQLRAERLRQELQSSQVRVLKSGPNWVRVRVAPGSDISGEVIRGFAGGWSVLASQVEIVSAGAPDEYLLRVRPKS